MKKVKWGILSAANIAFEQMVPALRRSKNSEIVAIASKTREKAERFNIEKIYATYEELLEDANVEVVYIPLPNALHKEWIIKAAQAGKHVIVEKPAVLTSNDMDDILEVLQQTKTIFIEGFMYQYHKQHREVKRLLKEGCIGEITHIKTHFSFLLQNREDIRMNKALGGGAFWDVGCYGLHAVTQLLDFKPAHYKMIAKVDEDKNVDLTSTCLLLDAQGRTAEVSASFEMPFENRYEIFGTKGTIVAQYAFRPDVSETGEAIVKVLNRDGHEQSRKTLKDDQYVNQVEYLNDCILNNIQPEYDAEKTKEMIALIESCYNSMYNLTQDD